MLALAKDLTSPQVAAFIRQHYNGSVIPVTDENMIKIENLSKHYPGTTAAALTEVTLTIETGAIFGILGRSGAGKAPCCAALTGWSAPRPGAFWLTAAISGS